MITPAECNPNKRRKLSSGKPAPHPMGFDNVPAFERPLELCIEGTIPHWVNGVLYRGGSGTYNILLDNGDTYHVSHPFDSLAMVHRFEICGSKQTIYYNSRHTSNGVEKRITDNDPTLVTFGPDICKSIFGRMQTVFHHLVNLKPNTIRRENEPELEVINTTITPNFPIGEQLENELNIKRGEALVAKHDVNFLQVIDPKSLKPLKMITYGRYSSYLDGPLSPSHHQFDEETNEFVNFVLKPGPFPTYQLFSIGPYSPIKEKELPAPEIRLYEPVWRHLGAWKTMRSLRAAYIHSFSMTKNYVIIPNYPYYFMANGLAVMYYSSAYQAFHWNENENTLFHIIDRHTGKHVATYEAEPCFSFHSVNAWDEEVELPGGYRERVIYMDMCTYDNAKIVEASFELGKKRSGKLDFDHIQPATYTCDPNNQDKSQIKLAELRRYRLGNVPVSAPNDDKYQPSWLGFSFNKSFTAYNKRRVASYTAIGYDLEMPCLNQKYNLKPYRYVWGVCSSKYTPRSTYTNVVNGLIKFDLTKPYTGSNTDEKSSAKIWDQPGCSCSEPIFIPNPEATSEDDGAVLSVVNEVNTKGEASFFILILNAATMEEMGRSTVGKFNAFTLHGSFVDQNGKGVTIG